MKSILPIFNVYLLFCLFLSIYCKVEEGNILLPMTSNFTIEHSESKVNNKNYYTIPLKVGTPEAEYEVQVDTSTATSWIPSSKCKNCKLAHRLYDEEDSRTSSPTDIFLEIEDEDGDVQGYQTSDNIKLFITFALILENVKKIYLCIGLWNWLQNWKTPLGLPPRRS